MLAQLQNIPLQKRQKSWALTGKRCIDTQKKVLFIAQSKSVIIGQGIAGWKYKDIGAQNTYSNESV